MPNENILLDKLFSLLFVHVVLYHSNITIVMDRGSTSLYFKLLVLNV